MSETGRKRLIPPDPCDVQEDEFGEEVPDQWDGYVIEDADEHDARMAQEEADELAHMLEGHRLHGGDY